MMKYILYSLILLRLTSVFGQQYTGELQKVTTNGFHIIMIPPEVRSATNNNLDFFRILDTNSNQVPYTIIDLNSKNSISSYVDLKILNKIIIPNKQTQLIIHNPDRKKMDKLLLTIVNTDVEKKYSISGSYDNKEWFGLVNNKEVSYLTQEGDTQIAQEFSFPLNDYEYLRFDFIDKNSLPINVLKAQYLQNNPITSASQIELKNYKQAITHDKQKKVTQIAISFNEPQFITQFTFDIATSMFLRQSRVLVNRTQKIKRKIQSYQETLFTFENNSKYNNQFTFEPFFEKDFIIEIDNQDDQPLDIKGIHLYQEPKYVMAKLEASQQYKIFVSNTLQTPVYDLQNFQEAFSKNLPQANISNFVKVTTNVSHDSPTSIWQSPYFMWACIVLAIVLIGYFALGLLKDLNTNDKV